MTPPTFDFSESTDDRTDLKPGWAKCLVSSAEAKKSKASGAPMFAVTLDPIGHDGLHIIDYVMLSGKAAKWHSKKLKAILGNTEDFEDGEEISPVDLVERTVYVCLHHEAYEGKNYLRVDNNEGECGYRADTPGAEEGLAEPEEGFEDIPF